MPLTSAQLKSQVLADVNDDGTVAAVIDTLWTKNDGRPSAWSQYLYTRLDAIDLLIAKNRAAVQTSGDGRTLYLQQVVDNLLKLRGVFQMQADEFVDTESEPVIEEMLATSPIMGNVGHPDPNSGIFTGDPVTRQTFRGWW